MGMSEGDEKSPKVLLSLMPLTPQALDIVLGAVIQRVWRSISARMKQLVNTAIITLARRREDTEMVEMVHLQGASTHVSARARESPCGGLE